MCLRASNAAGMIPIVSALIEKGASLGTALAFMIAAVGLSLPDAFILRRVLIKPQHLIIFFRMVAAAINITGNIFNLVI
jgi:uncharacterized protein